MENHSTIDANVDSTTTFNVGYGLYSFGSDKDDASQGNQQIILFQLMETKFIYLIPVVMIGIT